MTLTDFIPWYMIPVIVYSLSIVVPCGLITIYVIFRFKTID